MYYDRSISGTLLEALAPKGAFAVLAEIGRTRHLADLQLRGYPNTTRCWATLYVGLTKVIDVHEHAGQLWLTGVAADPSWTQRRPVDEWHAIAGELHPRIDAEIRNVAGRFTNEGAVQAMLCTRAARLFSVVDREAVVGFRDTSERHAVYERLQKPLADACAPDPGHAWFVPKKFGGELDILAVDPDGRLLAIEVKPGSATAGIAWAPLQATFYAKLLRAWSDDVGETSRDAIERMLAQRVELRLTRDPIRPLRYPLDIVPVVAIGDNPKSPAALPRLSKVQAALLDAGVGCPELEVWTVEESVARERLFP